MPRALLILAALVLGAALAPAPALAHKVSLFAYVEDGVIKGEGYFAGGDKAKDCQVTLTDPQGKELGSARTDEKGAFTMPAPATPPPWTLVMQAGQGHQAGFNLRAEDVGQAAAAPAEAAAEQAQAPAETAPAAGLGLSPAQLEELVGRAVERRLEPIKAQLARMQGENSFSLRDIMGGFGYILGLMGLAAYLKSRKS